MSNEKPILGYEEPDRDANFKPVTAPDRRRLFRKLVTLAGLGITGVLLSQETTGLLPTVHATTVSYSDTASPVVEGYNTASGIGIYGISTSGIGIEADTTGTGIPLVVINGSGSATILQEWRDVYGSTLSMVDAKGNFLVGGPGTGIADTTSGSVHVDASHLNDGSSIHPGLVFSNYGSGEGITSNRNGVYDLGFWTNSLRRLTISNAGNVGIGTSTPVSPVEVAGLVKSSLGTALGQSAINVSSLLCASQDSWTVGEFSSHSTSGNPQFYFYRSRGTRTGLAAVASGDYIGSLLGNAYDGSAWGGSSGVAQIRFAIDGTVGTGSLPTRIVFATTPSGSNTPTERMRITNTGQVGIGTTSPTHMIQLAGGAYSDGSTWNPSSSVRWKENIQPLTDGVDMLKQLHPVAYNYKKTPARRTMGFIAEEVGKVLPSVVDWDKAEPGYAEGYDHLAILAISVQAFKEQQIRIEQLAARNNELQSTVERLQERIDVLEHSMKHLTS